MVAKPYDENRHRKSGNSRQRAWISADLLFARDIPRSVRLVYAFLEYRAGKRVWNDEVWRLAFPSYDDVQEHTGLCRQAVADAFKILERSGLIQRIPWAAIKGMPLPRNKSVPRSVLWRLVKFNTEETYLLRLKRVAEAQAKKKLARQSTQ